MKNIICTILFFSLLLLSSCIYFKTINQPTAALPNEIFTVSITVTTEGGEYEPYFGVCLPIGWAIPGDSIQCSGAYNETIYYDSLVSIEQENASPAPTGYYWWAGKGVADANAIGKVSANLLIQTDNQLGRFFIDYMLGSSNPEIGVNHERSDSHQIDIVRDRTPSNLQATIINESVSLSWDEPLNINGLLGYNIYRDEQQINQFIVGNNKFVDENPPEAIRYYKVSSLYSNGSEYIIPYKVRVVLGNSLYVSPNGSDSSSGSSFSEALLTINYALSLFTPDSLNPKTIYLSEGIFSPNTNGELFPLEWKNNINLLGISQEETILNGDNLNRIISAEYIADAKFKDFTIRNGHSNGLGGGVYCYYSNPDFKNINIENNYSTSSGGGISVRYSNPTFENVEIKNNSCSGYGGGISINYSNPYLKKVTIANNSSATESGGGISITYSNSILENVTVENNFAGERGGGIYIDYSYPHLQNVILINNSTTGYGGGICIRRSSPILLNVTMTNNYAEIGGGGLFLNRGSNTILKNCILWNDSLAEIYFGNSNSSNTITVSYSNVQGGPSGVIRIRYDNATVNWLEGNIDVDPLLGSGNYPFILSNGSPCIDAGDPDTVYNDPEDSNNLGFALWPAMGTLRNDMGAYGGPNAASWNIIVTDIEEDDSEELQTPTDFELAQNYPNPFNPSTTIKYSLKERSSVELILYDILGREVKVLVKEEQNAEYYKVNFNAGSLASGIYFYRIQAGDFVQTKKMVLMK